MALLCTFQQQFFPSYCSQFFLWHFYYAFAVYFWYILLDHFPKVLCYFHVIFSWTTKFYIVLKAVYSPYVEVLYCSISGEALPVIEKEYQSRKHKNKTMNCSRYCSEKLLFASWWPLMHGNIIQVKVLRMNNCPKEKICVTPSKAQ